MSREDHPDSIPKGAETVSLTNGDTDHGKESSPEVENGKKEGSPEGEVEKKQGSFKRFGSIKLGPRPKKKKVQDCYNSSSKCIYKCF